MTKTINNIHLIKKEDSNDYILFNRDSLSIIEITGDKIGVTEDYLLKRSNNSEIYDELKDLDILNESIELELISEFKPQFVAFRIVLTENCNLRCKNCFVINPRETLIEMSEDTLIQTLEFASKYGKDTHLKFQFFGGEPLMKFNLIKKAVDFLNEKVVKNEILRPVYTITTNGILLNDKILDFFQKNNFQVGISIEGFKEDNDKIRVFANGQGTFDFIEKAFKKLEAYNIKRWFLITPYQENLKKIPQLIEYLNDNFSFNTITLNTPFDGSSLSWKVNGMELAILLLDCIKLGKKLGIEVESAASSLLYTLSNGIKREYPCSLYNYEIMASISPDGRISYCAQNWDKDLFHSKIDKDFQLNEQIIKSKSCNICIAKNVCGGPCPVRKKYTQNDLDINKCLFYRTFIERFISNIGKYVEMEN